MERQEVSQNGCGQVGRLDLDVSKLGVGTEETKPSEQGGTASSDGAVPRVKKKNYHYKQVLTPAQKERKRLWTRKRYQIKKEHCRKVAVDFYHKHRDKILAKKAEKRRLDPSISERKRHYDKANAAAKRARTKAWIIKNKSRFDQIKIAYLPRRRELAKIRRTENPQRRISENCRSRVWLMVTRFNPNRTYKTFDLIGCTPDFFIAYLEAQFAPEMNWGNYGEYWVVDHVIPLAHFDLRNPDQLKQAFHYSNCRPLDGVENSIKCASLPGPHQPLLV